MKKTLNAPSLPQVVGFVALWRLTHSRGLRNDGKTGTERRRIGNCASNSWETCISIPKPMEVLKLIKLTTAKFEHQRRWESI